MARKNQYEIGIGADTSGLEKSISNGLVDPLEEAADAFDDLEKAANGADLDKELDKAAKATDRLSGDLDDTRDKLKHLGYAAQDAGDDARRGMNRAEDGVEEFGREAQSTAKESAASFDGSAESIADAFQEIAANAFAGFGPAGAVAGLAIAAGIGIGIQAFQDAEEAAEELRRKANEYANDAVDAGVSAQAWLTASEQVVARIRELQDVKDNGPFRLWFMEDPDNLDKWVDGLKRMGRATTDVEKVLSSSDRAVEDYRDAVDESRKSLVQQRNAMIDAASHGKKYSQSQIDGIKEQITGTRDVLDLLDDEIQLREKSAAASANQSKAGVDGALARAQAEEDLADRVKSSQEAVVDSTLSAYDSMRSAAYEKATADDEAFNTGKWLDYVEETRKAADAYKANIASMQLTPAEWENFLALPEDARSSIAASYQKAGDDGKARIRAALSDTGSTAGAEATVGFDTAFKPEASVDVDVTADTTDAEAALDAAAEDRTATIKAKLTGEKSVRADLTYLARKRTVTVEPRLDATRINREMAAWRRSQEARVVTIRSKIVTSGGWD